jgi:hypothetical protein
MMFKSSQFQYQADTKAYVAEASELNLGGKPSQYITLDGWAFVFVGADMDASNEDTYGWNYKPTINAVELNAELAGKRLLIIND